MNTSARAVRFDDVTIWVELHDGRTIGVPMAWFPRLLHATPAQREPCRISVAGRGLHWEDPDEDISVEGLLAGRGDMIGAASPRGVIARPERSVRDGDVAAADLIPTAEIVDSSNDFPRLVSRAGAVGRPRAIPRLIPAARHRSNGQELGPLV